MLGERNGSLKTRPCLPDEDLNLNLSLSLSPPELPLPVAVPLSVPGLARDQSEPALEVLPVADHDLQPLLVHYATSIAPRMVWLDSEHNEYKRLVVPLAETQKALRFAIVAIAAAHAPDQAVADLELSQAAGKNALLMITERMRRMAESDMDTRSDQHVDDGYDTDEGVLAAAAIVSNHSLLTSELSLAQMHRQAVRVLIKSIACTGPSNEELYVFLTNQAAIYDILTCTTLFDPEHITHAILPEQKHGDVLFGHFLQVIHDITILSVSTSAREDDGSNPNPNPNPSAAQSITCIGDVEDRFELARSSTLVEAASFSRRCGGPTPIDFIRLVSAYHHAGMLYACKRLTKLNLNGTGLEEYHTATLFRIFERFEALRGSIYNLAWPVFIAGICSWPNVERMRTVGELAQMVLDNTKSRHYKKIPAFHHELWESHHHDWIALAQDWERRRIPIIAV